MPPIRHVNMSLGSCRFCNPKPIEDPDNWQGDHDRELGISVAFRDREKPFKQSVLKEAELLISGDRRQAYGSPLDNWTRTAQLWSGILGIDVTAEAACLCMIAVKVARETHRPGRDNRVDIAGYVGVLDEICTEREVAAAQAEDKG